MKRKPDIESFEELEKLAHRTDDIRALTPKLRRDWEAMQKTGSKLRPGRPRKDPDQKSRIVPISMEPALLKAIDKYAKSAGMTRSRLVAEGLRMRLNK